MIRGVKRLATGFAVGFVGSFVGFVGTYAILAGLIQRATREQRMGVRV